MNRPWQGSAGYGHPAHPPVVAAAAPGGYVAVLSPWDLAVGTAGAPDPWAGIGQAQQWPGEHAVAPGHAGPPAVVAPAAPAPSAAGGFGFGAGEEDLKERRKRQQAEYQRELARQIEEQAR